MAQEPSGDARGFYCRPRPLSYGSVFPAEVNATGNSTQTASTFNYLVIVIPVALLIGLCGLVGNGTVIWLLGFRVKRNPFSVYILNLAIADFTYHLCITVKLLISMNCTVELKELILPFASMSYLAGMMLLMAISTERCVSALFPIWYRCHRPEHLSTIVCAVVWGLSVCLQIPFVLCAFSEHFFCYPVLLIYIVTSFLTLLVLCASSLTLLIRVRCGSRQRQTTKLYRVILLTVLAFLVLGLPLNIGFLISLLFPSLFDFYLYMPIFYILSILNSAVNPIIYFFVGRKSQQPGRKSLREVLQSALTEDSQLSM